MKSEKVLRLGIVGAGGIGTMHANSIASGKVPNLRVAAIADLNTERFVHYGEEVLKFETAEELISSGEVDAILVATPHYDHTTVGIQALSAGIHLLVEKPISVHKADCERLIAAHQNEDVVFAAMFNQRTDPFFQKIHGLVHSGALGEIHRINWIITDWFRTEAYYRSGGWRATWSGEGGGVLLNQCPHNLDLWQWIFGMPEKIWADCQLGRHHHIEVEDEVTAYMKYSNGATGTFITSTGETPGTNRLEVTGDNGKLVYENGQLNWTRNTVPSRKFCKESKQGFSRPEVWNVSFPMSPDDHGRQHNGILENFGDAILNGADLIAPAAEGMASVELCNAMLMSSAKQDWVSLPLDGGEYEALLKKRIEMSTYEKPKAAEGSSAGDIGDSF